MNELSISEINQKIEQVKIDLAKETGRKYEVLSEYKSYLEDELEFLQREQRDSK